MRKQTLAILIGLSLTLAWVVAYAEEVVYLPLVQSDIVAATPPATVVPTPTPKWPDIELELVNDDLDLPVSIVHAGDGSDRLFVVEQEGRISIVEQATEAPWTRLQTPFLAIQEEVACCSELGLLGLAFDPDFETNGYFYVNYTAEPADQPVSHISRFKVGDDPNVADPGSEEVLLTYQQPFINHNGGQLAFGPEDGYLYIGVGDGGASGDPMENGQALDTLLGKILRIDVSDDNTTYTIPPDNPFAGQTGLRGEIWAYGLRNPWRFSFDRETHDLWIADVGQNEWEEINRQPAESGGGENYGWSIMEGAHCFEASDCDMLDLTLPVAEYSHGSNNISITGGYVIRSDLFPQSQGVYLYADWGSGRVWGLRQERGKWVSRELLDTSLNITSFGEDESGDLYLAHHGAQENGELYRLHPATR